MSVASSFEAFESSHPMTRLRQLFAPTFIEWLGELALRITGP